MTTISELLPLFRELNDLKRLRIAGATGSIAERLFRRSWARLIAGEPLQTVALSETANAVVAAKLAGIDATVLRVGGLEETAALEVLRRAFDASADVLPTAFAAHLRAHIGEKQVGSLTIPNVGAIGEVGEVDEFGGIGKVVGSKQGTSAAEKIEGAAAGSFEQSASVLEKVNHVPEFVELLARQPRAGATRPGMGRIVLEPTENHAEHCGIVAVNCVLAAAVYGADAGAAFLTGLSHHFHNAYLPDAGDAGDHLLGEHHARLMQTFRERALAQLPGELARNAWASLDSVYRSDTPASKSFQAADSLDRVLEMEWHARSAEFTLGVALEQMDIIHPGPVQAFQLEVMREVGFM